MIFEGGPLHAALPFGYSIEAPSAESRQCNPEAYALSELSISRSVGRAFEVLEYFRNARAPCSTPELEKALNVPYSSVRAILKSLKTLGYLEFHAERKTYFPTEKLMNLGNWVHGAMFESEPLTQLLHSVHRRLDETIAIATPNFIFCNLIGVRNGSRPQSLQVPGGIGLTLAQSTAGRVLLSQMSDTQIERLVQHTRYWAATTRSPMASDLAEVMPAIEVIRERGSAADYGGFKAGIGTVAYRVPSPSKDTPLALLVSGPSVRIKRDETRIRRALELYLCSYRAQLPRGTQALRGGATG
jgi:DNA-binding IclR family transcriptional regulator